MFPLTVFEVHGNANLTFVLVCNLYMVIFTISTTLYFVLIIKVTDIATQGRWL